MSDVISELFDGCFENSDTSLFSYCIGSGSCFDVYKDITYSKALEIFNSLPIRNGLGSLEYKKDHLEYKLECYHSLESFSGFTYLFMFPVNIISEVDYGK